MPLDGNGVASKPAGTTATPNTTIESAKYNSVIDDIYAIFNTARPISKGGTGATTASGARTALGLEIGVNVMAYSADLDALIDAFTAASASGPASLALGEDTDNGAHKATIIAPASMAADRVLTLPDATDTLAGLAATQTLTNKRVTQRTLTVTSSATPAINTDSYDAVDITALATAITSMTSSLTGTPTNFQKLIVRIKDNGSARAVAWGTAFEARGVALPTTTVAGKVLTIGFIYDTTTSKWGCVAVAQEA